MKLTYKIFYEFKQTANVLTLDEFLPNSLLKEATTGTTLSLQEFSNPLSENVVAFKEACCVARLYIGISSVMYFS